MKTGQKIFRQRCCNKFTYYIYNRDMKSCLIVFSMFNAFYDSGCDADIIL
jgi:hypothetical protein